MSYGGTRLGGSAFNHAQNPQTEQEYDRLRDLARDEHSKQQHFAAESRKAYERGDGAGAHNMSEEGKKHAQAADNYNRQASEFIFRENNAVGKVNSDTIDLHGQFVEEAETIVEQRIKYAKSTGQTHLHVIVGKGNHSVNHIQKIKPMVERVCQEQGLQYHTEQNEGRMYVDLTGGNAPPPSQYQSGPSQNYSQEQYGKPHYETAYPMGGGASYGAWSNQQHGGAQQQYGGQQQHQQQHYGGQQQQGGAQQEFDYEAEIKKNLPAILRLFKRNCCVVM